MKKTVKFLSTVACMLTVTVSVFAQKPSPELLTPDNHVLVMIDHESQMAFPVNSISIDELRNNAALIAGGSKIFNVPTVATTVAEKSFSGPVFPEVLEIYPKEIHTINRNEITTVSQLFDW